MKKILLSITILSLMVGATSISAQAIGLEKERGTISVNTSANTEVAPDVAEISFAVQTSDMKSIKKATLENKEISDKVFSLLKSMIDKAIASGATIVVYFSFSLSF